MRPCGGSAQAPRVLSGCCVHALSPRPLEGHKAHMWPGVWATVYRAAVTRTLREVRSAPTAGSTRGCHVSSERPAPGEGPAPTRTEVSWPVWASGPSFMPPHLYVRVSEHRVLTWKTCYSSCSPSTFWLNIETSQADTHGSGRKGIRFFTSCFLNLWLQVKGFFFFFF